MGTRVVVMAAPLKVNPATACILRQPGSIRSTALLVALLVFQAQVIHASHSNTSTADNDADAVKLRNKAYVADGSQEKPYQVAMNVYSPFVIKGGEGYTVELMKEAQSIIQDSFKTPFECEYHIFANVSGGDNILKVLHTGDYNFAIAGITITPKREKLLTDFGEAHFPAGTGLLTKRPKEIPMSEHMWNVFTSESTATTLCALCIASLIFANLIYFAECTGDTDNADSIFTTDDYVGGITTALWFIIVTVTTTGYGDIVPQTRRGRFVASLWMGIGLVIMAMFSADVLSRMTASRSAEATGGIVGPGSMSGTTCGTTEGSPWIDMCSSWGAVVKAAPSRAQMFADFENGITDAVAYDWPVLELWMQETDQRMVSMHMPWRSTTDGPFGPGFPHLAKPSKDVSTGNVNQDDLAAVERHYRMREMLNHAFLSLKGGEVESRLVAKYFGGLSITSVGSRVAGETYKRARMNDPYVATALAFIFFYIALISSHAVGVRVPVYHGMPFIAGTKKAGEEEEKVSTMRDEEELAGAKMVRNGSAVGSSSVRLARLEQRLERVTQLVEEMGEKVSSLAEITQENARQQHERVPGSHRI